LECKAQGGPHCVPCWWVYSDLVLCFFFLCVWVQGLRHSPLRACIFRGIINLALARGHFGPSPPKKRKTKAQTTPVDIDICLARLEKYVYLCKDGHKKERSSVNPMSWLLNCRPGLICVSAHKSRRFIPNGLGRTQKTRSLVKV